MQWLKIKIILDIDVRATGVVRTWVNYNILKNNYLKRKNFIPSPWCTWSIKRETISLKTGKIVQSVFYLNPTSHFSWNSCLVILCFWLSFYLQLKSTCHPFLIIEVKESIKHMIKLTIIYTVSFWKIYRNIFQKILALHCL